MFLVLRNFLGTFRGSCLHFMWVRIDYVWGPFGDPKRPWHYRNSPDEPKTIGSTCSLFIMFYHGGSKSPRGDPPDNKWFRHVKIHHGCWWFLVPLIEPNIAGHLWGIPMKFSASCDHPAVHPSGEMGSSAAIVF